ncbi:MAG TPA: hypothetical protein VHL08_00775 [Dongiaceae bacterium]|jgi:hypothetical protein|nr:hypothetical protein [Dongiaceae bacterium]
MRLYFSLGSGLAFILAIALVYWFNNPITYYLLSLAAAGFLGVLTERFRYKKLEADTPGKAWVKTPEKFIDPETHKQVTVYYCPENGERRYITER